MEKGARHRNNTEKNHPGGSESEASPESGSGGGGVALKKEIGLVSACGIIVGESNYFSHPPLLPFSGGLLWKLSSSKVLFLLPTPQEKNCHSPVL